MKDQELKNAFDKIQISDNAQKRIIRTLKEANYERNDMHMRSKKKLAIIAAAAAFILSITAFAASGIINTWYSSSLSIPEYTELPTSAQLIKSIGYTGDTIERFSNGYVFKEGNIVKNALADDSNHTVEKFKSVTLRYTNGENEVSLSIDKYDSDIPQNGKEIYTDGDVTLYAHSFINKVIPENYVKTPEEEAAEERGDLYFAYDGINHIEEHKVVSVSWKKDGISYDLMQINGELSEDDLCSMAKELIK